MWSLSAKARALWIQFVDHVEIQMREGGEYETVRSLANKLPEHAARLATVLALLADFDTSPRSNGCYNSTAYSTDDHTISAEALAAGITIAQYYAGEAVRLCAAGFVDPPLQSAVRMLTWIRKRLAAKGRVVTFLAEMYQFGPPEIRSASAARDAVRTLEDHGWLVPVSGGAEIDGEHRHDVWWLRGQS